MANKYTKLDEGTEIMGVGVEKNLAQMNAKLGKASEDEGLIYGGAHADPVGADAARSAEGTRYKKGEPSDTEKEEEDED